MKISVAQKEFKILIITLVSIIWVIFLALGIWESVAFNESLTPLVIVIEVLVIALWLITTIVLIRICRTFVAINEFGVTRYIGRQVIDSIKWNEIDKIELVEFVGRGVRRLMINVVLTVKKSMERKATIDRFLFDKRKTGFPYSKTAYEEIKMYYANDIDNAYLSVHYDNIGKPL